MGNSSSGGSSGAPGDRYREGGKEARAKILLDTTEDGDPDPKVPKFPSRVSMLTLARRPRLILSPFGFLFVYLFILREKDVKTCFDSSPSVPVFDHCTFKVKSQLSKTN